MTFTYRVLGYHLNRLDKPVFMALTKPMLISKIGELCFCITLSFFTVFFHSRPFLKTYGMGQLFQSFNYSAFIFENIARCKKISCTLQVLRKQTVDWLIDQIIKLIMRLQMVLDFYTFLYLSSILWLIC